MTLFLGLVALFIILDIVLAAVLFKEHKSANSFDTKWAAVGIAINEIIDTVNTNSAFSQELEKETNKNSAQIGILVELLKGKINDKSDTEIQA